MIALLLLGLAVAVLRWGGAGLTVALIAMALAAAAGTTLPDLDQLVPLGGHRSALSHSLLPAAPALRRRWRAIAAGLCFGLALHLVADLFPRAMRGFATIKLLGESLGADGSRLWLAGNVALGFAAAALLAAGLVRDVAARRALAALATIAASIYLAGVDGGWWAMLLLVAIAWLVWRARRPAA